MKRSSAIEVFLAAALAQALADGLRLVRARDLVEHDFRLGDVLAEEARDVIRKNVYTVQQVARLFGEHIAETEIMLNEIAGAYESQTVGKRLREGGSEEYLNG